MQVDVGDGVRLRLGLGSMSNNFEFLKRGGTQVQVGVGVRLRLGSGH